MSAPRITAGADMPVFIATAKHRLPTEDVK